MARMCAVYEQLGAVLHREMKALRNGSPRPAQPSIPPGSVNEYQLRLEKQRQVWFIPLADERGVCR